MYVPDMPSRYVIFLGLRDSIRHPHCLNGNVLVGPNVSCLANVFIIGTELTAVPAGDGVGSIGGDDRLSHNIGLLVSAVL
jgi:hypothetical protein